MDVLLTAQAAVPRNIGLWEWFSRGETWTGDGGKKASRRDRMTADSVPGDGCRASWQLRISRSGGSYPE